MPDLVKRFRAIGASVESEHGEFVRFADTEDTRALSDMYRTELALARQKLIEADAKISYYEAHLCFTPGKVWELPGGARTQSVAPERVTDVLEERDLLRGDLADKQQAIEAAAVVRAELEAERARLIEESRGLTEARDSALADVERLQRPIPVIDRARGTGHGGELREIAERLNTHAIYLEQLGQPLTARKICRLRNRLEIIAETLQARPQPPKPEDVLAIERRPGKTAELARKVIEAQARVAEDLRQRYGELRESTLSFLASYDGTMCSFPFDMSKDVARLAEILGVVECPECHGKKGHDEGGKFVGCDGCQETGYVEAGAGMSAKEGAAAE